MTLYNSQGPKTAYDKLVDLVGATEGKKIKAGVLERLARRGGLASVNVNLLQFKDNPFAAISLLQPG